jgi:hypothetical protein
MPDRVKDFEAARAVESIATDDRVEDRREQFRVRYMELLRDPAKRNPGILEDLILELFELDALEDDDIESAAIYWQSVGDLVADNSFEELYQVPLADRGGKFSDASKLMVLVARTQAFIEIFAIDEARSSVKSGEEIKKAAARFTRAELKDLSDGMIDIKAAKTRIKEGQSNGVGDAP